MAESPNKTSAAVNSKEKTLSLDLDIGKDFLSSWKSMSVAAEDAMDFDLAPISKGKNKPFEFEKADMDFHLDGDFGEISSFNMDMSDLDISSPLKKDATSKEKSKENSCGNDKGRIPSFDMDMSDLDFSPPLKKDGTSREMSKEFSSGKDKGKTDRFTFAFDFDDLENFSFDPSLTKEAPKAQKQNDSIQCSPNGRGSPETEGSSMTKLVGNMSTIEDVPHKQTLPGSTITANMDCQDGGSADLETTTKNELAMDDSIALRCSTAADEVSSDKGKTSSETRSVSDELPKNTHPEQSISVEQVDVEACSVKDADGDLPSNSLFNNESSGGNSLGSLDKVYFINEDATGSIQEQDVNYSLTVAISEKNNDEKSECLIENHVTDNKEKNSSLGAFYQLSTGRENQDPASEILTLSSASLLAEKLSAKETEGLPSDKFEEKETENEKEPSVTCSRISTQMEKAKCHTQKAPSMQKTNPPVSSKKKCSAQPILDESRRGWNSIQGNRKLASLPMQHSQMLPGREQPQSKSQEGSKGLKTRGEVYGASGGQTGNKLNASFTTQTLDVLRGKSVLGQSITSMRDLDTHRACTTLSSLSTEINKKTAQRSKIPLTVASLPSMKSSPVDEKNLSACEGSRKTSDLHGPKLSSLKLDSVKSSSQREMKSVGDISQNRVPPRKSPMNIAHFADSQKLTPSIQSLKRKMIQENSADKIVLYPSKRCFLSPIESRNYVDSSTGVLEKKLSNQNNVEDDCIKSQLGNCQVSTIDVLSKENTKRLEMSSLDESESHIKQAEAYTKELDDICNSLTKKREDAKELLVRAIVNNNKLLMLNYPLLHEKISFILFAVQYIICPIFKRLKPPLLTFTPEKICAIQNSLTTLTLKDVHA